MLKVISDLLSTMSIKLTKTIQIALMQLETALRLYYEGLDYFSVITLAGAAEESLGKKALAVSKKHALSDYVSAAQDVEKVFDGRDLPAKVAISRLNHPKNMLKHVDPTTVPAYMLDAKDEAETMLQRAIKNCEYAGLPLSKRMQQFQNEGLER